MVALFEKLITRGWTLILNEICGIVRRRIIWTISIWKYELFEFLKLISCINRNNETYKVAIEIIVFEWEICPLVNCSFSESQSRITWLQSTWKVNKNGKQIPAWLFTNINRQTWRKSEKKFETISLSVYSDCRRSICICECARNGHL